MTQQISSAAVHILTGRLGNDPMACATQNNSAMTVFSLRITRRVQGEYVNTWYRIKTYGALAESCLAYLHKDRLVQVLGSQMTVWAYTDQHTGAPRGALELVADSVIFLDPPNANRAGAGVLPNGDIPFSIVVEGVGVGASHVVEEEEEEHALVG